MSLVDLGTILSKKVGDKFSEYVADPIKEAFASDEEKQKNINQANQKAKEVKAIVLPELKKKKQEYESLLNSATDPKIKAGLKKNIQDVDQYITKAESLTGETLFRNPKLKNLTGIDMYSPTEEVAQNWLKLLELPKLVDNPNYQPVDFNATNQHLNKQSESKKIIKKSTKTGINFDESSPEEELAPASTPTPQAQPQQEPSQRLTTATTPAEFKPALMDKEKAKTEDEYLGKDRSKWVNMSTADKVAGLAGLLGDAGGDIVDIVAAAHGIENGGAERLKKRRDEINQRREERKREYQEYLNRVDDINRQIAMHNNTINNSAMAKFNADNAYRMINYQAQQQAAAQAAAGLYM